MKRMYSSQIITPKRAGPPIRTPLIRGKAAGCSVAANRIMAAIITGPPTSTARNTERRDHNIWPSDRSKIRTDDARRRGRPGADGLVMISFHQVLEDGLQVVVRGRDLVNGAKLARRRELGEPRIERVRPRCLDDDRLTLELQIQHIVRGQKLPREGAGLIRLDVDHVGMLVDELANLMDVAFG